MRTPSWPGSSVAWEFAVSNSFLSLRVLTPLYQKQRNALIRGRFLLLGVQDSNSPFWKLEDLLAMLE